MTISANVYILMLVLALCWVLAQAGGQLIDAPTLGGTINVMCYCRSDSKLVYSREQLLGIANVLRARKQIPTLPPLVEAAAHQACIYRHQGSRRRCRGGVGCRYTIPVVVGGMTPPIMKSICGQCGVNTSNLVPLTKCVGTDLSATCAIPVAINYRPNAPGSPHCSQRFLRPINLVQTGVQR